MKIEELQKKIDSFNGPVGPVTDDRFTNCAYQNTIYSQNNLFP